MFLDNGKFSGLHFVGGSTLAGHPRGLLGASNSTSAPEPISWANFIDDINKFGAQEPDGKFGRTFSVQGLNVTISGSMGTFSGSASAQKSYGDGSTKTLYADPIALSVLAGSYNGLLRTAGISEPQQVVTGFSVDATGAFSVKVANCMFTGTMVQHGVSGVFDATVQTSGANCHLNAAMSGLVVPLSFSSNNARLSFQLDSADNTQSAVFIVSKG